MSLHPQHQPLLAQCIDPVFAGRFYALVEIQCTIATMPEIGLPQEPISTTDFAACAVYETGALLGNDWTPSAGMAKRAAKGISSKFKGSLCVFTEREQAPRDPPGGVGILIQLSDPFVRRNGEPNCDSKAFHAQARALLGALPGLACGPVVEPLSATRSLFIPEIFDWWDQALSMGLADELESYFNSLALRLCCPDPKTSRSEHSRL